MKKLLIFLCAILISLNSYGEWTEIAKNTDGAHCIDKDTFNKHEGY